MPASAYTLIHNINITNLKHDKKKSELYSQKVIVAQNFHASENPVLNFTT